MNFLIPSVLSALVFFATVHAVLSYTPLASTWLSFTGGLLVLASGFVMQKIPSSSRASLLRCVAIGYILILFTFHTTLFHSFSTLASLCLSAWDGSPMSFLSPPGTAVSPTFALYALLFFLLWVAVVGITSPLFRIVTGVMGLFSLVLTFYFGLDPFLLDILLITAFWMSLFIRGKSQAVVFVLALIPGMGLFLLYPENRYVQPSFLSHAQESFLTFTDPTASLFHSKHAFGTIAQGGAENGALGTVSGVHFTGRTVVDIQSETADNPLYIRHTVGSRYENNGWHMLPDSAYAETSPLFDHNQGEWYDQSAWLMEVISHSPSLSSAFLSYTPAGPSMAGLKQTFALSAVYGDTPYYFIPYRASFGSDIFLYDRAPKGNKQKIYTTYLWSPQPGALLSFLRDIPAEDPYYRTYVEGEARYRRFVYAHDLAVPEDLRNTLTTRLPIPHAKTLEEKRAWVETLRQFFRDQYRYTTHPGKTPNGADFISYFLTTQKEGYCTHFASAGVMLLRAAGIPARYVTGLVVHPDEINGSPILDGMHHTRISDRHSHAWAEVYVDGLGWEPCEFTPGKGTGDNPFSSPFPKQSVQTPPSPPKDDPVPQEKKEKASPQKNQTPQEKTTPPKESPQNKEITPPKGPSLPPVTQVPPAHPSFLSPALYGGMIVLLLLIFSFLYIRHRLSVVPHLLAKGENTPQNHRALIHYMRRLTAYDGHPLEKSYKEWKKVLSQDPRFAGFDTWLALMTEAKYRGTPLADNKWEEARHRTNAIRECHLTHQTTKERWIFRLFHQL